jgi:hypothetical protein
MEGQTRIPFLGNSTNLSKWIAPPLGSNSTNRLGLWNLGGSSLSWGAWTIIEGSVANAYPVAARDLEITDDELLLLMARSGSFAFLADVEEDIYSELDGTPIR